VSVVRRGGKWCIRYYGPDGRQRWETIGPNKKEAETVLHQRLHEVRVGIFPILRRRSRFTFEDHAREWMTTYAKSHVRASTEATYRWLLETHLLPEFGTQALTTITPAMIHAYVAGKIERLAPKTVNHTLALLREILEAAVEWGRVPSNPARRLRRLPTPRRDLRVWTLAEIRRFLLAAAPRWRPFFTVAVFTGLRLGELQAMTWAGANRPNFTTNKIEVTRAYDKRTKTTTVPKSASSVRTVEMVPTVRRLLSSPGEGLVFSRLTGGTVSRSMLSKAFAQAMDRAKVAPIRFHDLRHTYASLLIAAGKHPKYIAAQLGHASAAFTLDTYGHLMDRLPTCPVEWIDELVFPEGFEAALILHLSGAPQGVSGCSGVQPADDRKPLEIAAEAATCNPVQQGAWLGGQDSNLDSQIQSLMAYH
jgi:integrase